MAKYQKKPELADVASRRGQTMEQLLTEWGVKTLGELAKRCKREGVGLPAGFTFAFSADPKPKSEPTPPKESPRNALVEIRKDSLEDQKKAKKAKVNGDEPAVSPEHVRVVPAKPSDAEDPA